jgi:ubiquinone/menaquinone biosynthesis C-methylase UbiE
VRGRKQHAPWTAAGRATEIEHSADEVVRSTGWVFNNETGQQLTLAEFTATGELEVGSYLSLFDLEPPAGKRSSMVEIGAGIGRMTAAFTKRFDRVVACDLDAAFLERCRETVAAFGDVKHLSTVRVADGCTLEVPTDSVDLTFSYITLQHCERADALALTREAVRVTKPGGHIALNYRTWTARDVVLWPVGGLVRLTWKLPVIGQRLARNRLATRLGWQANRLAPEDVLAELRAAGLGINDVTVWVSPRRQRPATTGATVKTFEGINPSHWWVVATVS